ncbi:MAG: hypothetical protein M3342_15005 [Bacteroidota bacterium]|nr:hypothetical protein [Flavisolibacter sp.]MDQ3845301.1 hypothetical protein [Bacteroidota bacterium]MBD0285289.1 hypothetical protein [Flavisolibacter sp.]MBD0297240.1 hypothetical protein [Flavisolibacter sp.]MBD0352152.1 hypothetical protein [Flavisolibacter sp.]
MYIIRDIFYLKYGHYRDAKALFDEILNKNLLPEAKAQRVLSDFTGDAYRLIFEEGYDNLADYEKSLNESMKKEEWQQWYQKFREHVEKGYREILKQIL